MKKLLLLFISLQSIQLSAQTIGLNQFATGFTNPVEITHAGDSRLFVVEQGGRIKIINPDGSVNATPFLNISSIITFGGERGLLGLVFHPAYSSNGLFVTNSGGSPSKKLRGWNGESIVNSVGVPSQLHDTCVCVLFV